MPLNDEAALADRICQILESAGGLRAEMGKNARRWVRDQFSGERLADKTASVYEEVLLRKGLAIFQTGGDAQ